jgi:hypothetical protein
MRRTIRVCTVSVAILLVAAMSAQAAPVTVFSNFNSNPADLYDSSGFWDVLPAGGQYPAESPAMAFTPSGTYVLDQINVALELATGASSVTLTLYSDSDGAPGSVLASWNLTGLAGFESCCAVETVSPSGSIVLYAGSQYWIQAAAGRPTTQVGWMISDSLSRQAPPTRGL